MSVDHSDRYNRENMTLRVRAAFDRPDHDSAEASGWISKWRPSTRRGGTARQRADNRWRRNRDASAAEGRLGAKARRPPAAHLRRSVPAFAAILRGPTIMFHHRSRD